jgi:hypothetical protein
MAIELDVQKQAIDFRCGRRLPQKLSPSSLLQLLWIEILGLSHSHIINHEKLSGIDSELMLCPMD